MSSTLVSQDLHNTEAIPTMLPRDDLSSSDRHAVQRKSHLSDKAHPNRGSAKEPGASTAASPFPETLIAKINKIPKSDLEETLKKHPGYEPSQEGHGEDEPHDFIQAMLIVKRGSTDLETSEIRWAKIDTGSPVSLVPEETLEGLDIVPYRFGSHPLTGLVQSAIVEPVGLETIFWFDAEDTRDKPHIFQTTFQVLPRGTTRSFDFLLGADWLRAAQLQLAHKARYGQHTRTQSSVLCLRILNQMQ